MAISVRSVFKTLDARGTFCPLPVLLTERAISEIPVGEVLEILATDPGALGDIPAWAKNTKHELLDTGQEGDTFRFLVKRSH